MTSNEMFGNAKWLSPMKESQAPRIRGEFEISNFENAKITVGCLGFFELYINGKKVSEEIFSPVTSDYHHVPDAYYSKVLGEKLAHRIYCPQYDITHLLNEGKNCIAFFIGPGWYRLYDDIVKLCFKIETQNKGKTEMIVSDETWLKFSKSFITSYNMTDGEKHDYTLCRDTKDWMMTGFDDSEWLTLSEVESAESEYYIQNSPTDAIIRHIKPKLVNETENHYVYDCGENITGWPIIYCDSVKHETIVTRVGEEINRDKTINDFSVLNQVSEFKTNGTPQYMHIRFTWHAFRYIEVTKNAVIEDVAVIHSNVKVDSHFESDDEILNWLYDAFIRTQLGNMHNGIPSDCPHLERRGYTGDGQVCCDAVMLQLDSKSFYKKWMEDISDCQDRISGHVQYTAPYAHCGGGPGGWGCAIVEVPYTYYKHFGDTEILKKYFHQMLHYFDFLQSHSENDLVTSAQPGLWFLGEWCTPTKVKGEWPIIPPPFVNNYFFIKSINRVIEIAKIIGKDDEIDELEKLAEIKKQAIIKNYYDEKTGDFCENIQGANCFAFDLGLGDERTLANIVKHYYETGVFDTGIFGTDILIRILFENGYDHLAVSLLTSKGEPSFYQWMKNGATTLWEEWFDPRSMNHPMFGAVTRYFFYYILGIRQEKDSTGFEKVIISPTFASKLSYIKGHITTQNGKISVRLNRGGANTFAEIELEKDISATFVYENQVIQLKQGMNKITF